MTIFWWNEHQVIRSEKIVKKREKWMETGKKGRKESEKCSEKEGDSFRNPDRGLVR